METAKDIFDELEEIHLKKIRRIERLANGIVTKLRERRSQDLQALRNAVSQLRTLLEEAKAILKAAKNAQNRQIRARSVVQRP